MHSRSLVRLACLVALAPTSEPALAHGNLFGATVVSSVEASLEVTSQITTRATTAETSCKAGDEACRRCAWEACWSERLPLDVAATLLREAYAFDGPTLRQIAASLGVPPRTLAAAIVRTAPVDPTPDQLTRLLAIAAS